MNLGMARNTFRWILLAITMFILGPIAGAAASWLRGVDGSHAVSLLASGTGVVGAMGVAIGFALAGVAGIIASRLFGVRTGLFAAGLVLVWTAAKTGTVDGIARQAQEASVFRTLAIEGMIIGAATFALGFLIVRAAGGSEEAPDEPAARFNERSKEAPRMIGAVAACAVAGAIAAIIVARSSLPAQAIFAAAAAGVAGAMVALLVHQNTRIHWMLAALCGLAIVGPASAGFAHADVIHAMYKGSLTPLARITPLQWAAGLMLGVPVGLSWATSMIKKD
jgi:hypothetical protein